MSDSTPETLFESHLELAAKIGSNFPMANASIDECVQEAGIALPSILFEAGRQTVLKNIEQIHQALS